MPSKPTAAARCTAGVPADTYRGVASSTEPSAVTPASTMSNPVRCLPACHTRNVPPPLVAMAGRSSVKPKVLTAMPDGSSTVPSPSTRLAKMSSDPRRRSDQVTRKLVPSWAVVG